jgi:hypothetical protein
MICGGNPILYIDKGRDKQKWKFKIQFYYPELTDFIKQPYSHSQQGKGASIAHYRTRSEILVSILTGGKQVE